MSLMDLVVEIASMRIGYVLRYKHRRVLQKLSGLQYYRTGLSKILSPLYGYVL